MSQPSLQNLALVESTSSSNEVTVGTGYFVTPNRVLTARHVLGATDAGAPTRIRVRREEPQRWFDADLEPAWQPDAVDALVLSLRDDNEEFVNVDYGSSNVEVDCDWVTTAYPAAAAQASVEDDVVHYKSVGLTGVWHPKGGRGQSTRMLDLEVENPPKQWHGISGAPVIVDDCLIGIIDSAPLDFENRRLAGVPIEHIVQSAGFVSATTPVRHLSPSGSNWFLIVLAEGTPHTVEQLIARALENIEASRRGLGVDYVGDITVSKVVIRICDELHSPGNWLHLIELVARAPVMIVDVTRFQPAVMMLLGIRAVARRGVTVPVTKDSLNEAHLKGLPFNIQETRLISLSAHADDPRRDLVDAITAGIGEMRANPDYLDLPAYDSVRGPRPTSRGRGATAEMLVLCPFSEEYDLHWGAIKEMISANKPLHRAVRMLDITSPRLVGQALYEQIRWNRHCVVDWTWWRPNVFFELGVRLACSRDDPVLVIHRGSVEEVHDGAGLEQRHWLLRLFSPAGYTLDNEIEAQAQHDRSAEPFGNEIDGAFARHRDYLKGREVSLPFSVVPIGAAYDTVAAQYDWSQDRVDQRPHEELRANIQAQLGEDYQRDVGETQTLFSSNREFSIALENRVREEWLAAWFYAYETMRHEARSSAGEARETLSTLGEDVVQALRGSKQKFHNRMATQILDLIGEWDVDSIRNLKTKAKNRRDRGMFDRATKILSQAAELGERGFETGSEDGRSSYASELADVYGMLGGIARRQGLDTEDLETRDSLLRESYEYYDKGYRYERYSTEVSDSYNLVNRLVSRILADASVLTGPMTDDGSPDREASMIRMLQDAQRDVAKQIAESRNTDPWAHADQALLDLLASESANATSAYGQLHGMSPPGYVYESALATLRPLAAAAGAYRPELKAAVRDLESRLASRV